MSGAPHGTLARDGSVHTDRVAVLAAAAAGLASLGPGRAVAVVVLVLAAVTAFVAVAAMSRRRRLSRALFATLALATLLGAGATRELAPQKDPVERLADGAAHVEAQWNALLSRLDAAVRDIPPLGSDYGWVAARQQTLGPRSGLSVMSEDGFETLEWAGWTTRLREEERQALLDGLESDGEALLISRRGLSVRLLVARDVLDAEGRPEQIVAAELPLASEPSAGALAEGLDPALEARVRWNALGEGVQAEIGLGSSRAPRSAAAQTSTLPLQRSLVALMGPGSRAAGRVSLVAPPVDGRRVDLAATRRAVAGAGLAAWLVLLCAFGTLGGASRIVALIGARGALLAICTPLARHAASHAPDATRSWPDLPPLAEMPLQLIHTPLDGALTGLLLIALAACARRARSERARSAALAFGVVALPLSLALVWFRTVHDSLAPGAVFVPLFDRVATAGSLTAIELIAPVAAVLTLIAFTFFGRRATALALAASAGGLAAGVVNGAALDEAARHVVETELSDEIAKRDTRWRDALYRTLELAAPTSGRDDLTRDRDAIDLWWNSPLAELGLASGVWKYDPGDPLPVDQFMTGFPPVAPAAVLSLPDARRSGPFRRTFTEPRREPLPFFGGTVELLLAEVQRPSGGSWIAGVLVEPGNIPVRATSDPLLAARARGAERPPLRPEGLEPALAWFDESGRLLGSDLDVPPPAPLAPPPSARWRESDVGGRRAVLYEMPDATRATSGIVTAVFFPADALAKSALALSWSLLAGLLALAAAAATIVASRPLRGALRGGAEAIRRFLTEFGGQLAVAFLAVGLVALLLLAGAGRTSARRQAERQIDAEAERIVHFGGQLLRDFFELTQQSAFDPSDPSSNNDVASWLARALGEDTWAWEGGELIATSRPDLVRAGLWPERIDGEIWSRVALGRVPLELTPGVSSRSGSSDGVTVVHGPYGTDFAERGVFTVSLGGAGRRSVEELADVDRALLVSSVLLVLLSTALLVPVRRRLSAPLRALERATTKIASGEFDTPLPQTGFRETRALSRAFASMASSLASQRLSLERRRRAIDTLIASMPVAVVALTQEGVVWASNPRARELAHFGAGDRLPEQAGVVEDAIREAFAARGEHVRTVESPHDDDPEQARRLRISGLEIAGLTEGESARLILIEDLTDAVRAERLTAWAEMARRIAHEIKNPLTPISLMIEHVRRLAERDDPRLPDALDDCLETVADQVAVLRDTSREFSDYARLLVPRTEPLDVEASLTRWLAPWTTAPPAGVTVELAPPPDGVPPLDADERLLRRAVVNLIDNAVAAVNGAGRVTVSWEHRPGSPAEWRIAVADDGPGIEPSRAAGLFEPDVTTRETGSGLGLPIVREAVAAHGGRIDVDPRPGEGAVFTIVLPERSEAGEK